jgi:hypothetical protein
LIRSFKKVSKEAISKISSAAGSLQSIVNLRALVVLTAFFLALAERTFGATAAAGADVYVIGENI